MRTLTRYSALAAIFGALVCAVGCATTESNRADRSTFPEGPIESETATLVVHGMGCPLCANNVDRQLLAVSGVEDVRVDLGNGAVTVVLADSGRPTMAQLARAVDDSGFTLINITTP